MDKRLKFGLWAVLGAALFAACAWWLVHEAPRGRQQFKEAGKFLGTRDRGKG